MCQNTGWETSGDKCPQQTQISFLFVNIKAQCPNSFCFFSQKSAGRVIDTGMKYLCSETTKHCTCVSVGINLVANLMLCSQKVDHRANNWLTTSLQLSGTAQIFQQLSLLGQFRDGIFCLCFCLNIKKLRIARHGQKKTSSPHSWLSWL